MNQHRIFRNTLLAASGLTCLVLFLFLLAQVAAAAGPVRGVGTMGYGPATPSAPPPSSHGNTPGDFRRGYEGNSPSPGDPWNREADFKARNYELRHSAPPEFASPPDKGPGSPPAAQPLPTLPKPPLPGDRDMPPGSPGSGLE